MEPLRTNWPEIVAALSTLITLCFTLRIKSSQTKTDDEIRLIKAKAEAAALAAHATKTELSDSRSERHQQFQEVSKKIEENTSMNKAALDTAAEAVSLANNTNLKIKELREDFQSSQNPTV